MVVVNQLFTGISFGSLLLLIALGLTMIFGQMGVINMAQGTLYMFGAYTVYVLQGFISSAGVSLFLALPVAFVVSGLIGLLMEVTLIRRLYERPLDTLLVTWGCALVFEQFARNVFGATNKQTNAPEWLTGAVTVGQFSFPASRLFILALSLLAVLGLTVTLRFTPLGRRIRAVVQSRGLAATSGIPTARIDRTTFFIGCGLAGIAGVALTLIGSIGPTMGNSYIVDAFLVVVVGGIGQLRGTVIMAFAIGMANALLEYQLGPSLAKVLVFIGIVIFLQWRPQGLFTQQTRGLT